MTDDLLNTAAIAFEIGLPIVLGAVCLAKPSSRKLLVPILGAVTPLLIAYAYSTVGYYFVSKEDFGYGFLVMWVMSFFIYCLLLVVGLVVAVASRNRFSNYTRYFLGLLGAPSVAAIFLGVERAFS